MAEDGAFLLETRARHKRAGLAGADWSGRIGRAGEDWSGRGGLVWPGPARRAKPLAVTGRPAPPLRRSRGRFRQAPHRRACCHGGRAAAPCAFSGFPAGPGTDVPDGRHPARVRDSGRSPWARRFRCFPPFPDTAGRMWRGQDRLGPAVRRDRVVPQGSWAFAGVSQALARLRIRRGTDLPLPITGGMVRPHQTEAFLCRRSSGVEHTLGKGGVGCSIHPGGTIPLKDGTSPKTER